MQAEIAWYENYKMLSSLVVLNRKKYQVLRKKKTNVDFPSFL